MSKVTTVEQYRAAVSTEQLAVVDALRAAAMASAAGVTEHIKWNAPSFGIDGSDRITLGSDAKGSIRVILHRGAKVLDSSDFSFAVPADLVTWAAVDRGVMTFANAPALDARIDEVRDIFSRWMELTR